MKKIIIDIRIRELREEKHLSQIEFANLCAVKQSCVSKWERGATYPPLDMLVKIAEFFEVSTDYLIGITDF